MMDEIRLLVLKFLRLILIGSLLPVLVVLILAAINDRIRRILLWVTAPLAALAVVSYFIFAPIPPGQIQGMDDVLAAYKTGFLIGLPYLVGLTLVAGIVLFFGPSWARALRENQQRSARERYLSELVKWTEPQLSRYVVLAGRGPDGLPDYLQISGTAGVGKSLLLRSMLLIQARQALADETRPLPVLIDLDLLLASGNAFPNLVALQPAVLPANDDLLDREILARRVSLLIDSSLFSFAPVFASPAERQRRVELLVRIIEAVDPARLALALPPDVQSPALERLAPGRLTLEPLNAVEIRQAADGLIGKPAGPFVQELESAESGWCSLAERWFVLSLLARFYAGLQRLPADTCELLRETVYPHLPAETVQAGLARLAAAMLQEGQPALSHERATGLASPLGVRELEQSGLLKASGDGRMTTFAYPLLLACFSALAWRDYQPEQANIKAGMTSDPLIGDALIFFNNIAADPSTLAAVIEKLASQPGPGAQLLAAQCLLAAPASKRSAALVEMLSARLVGELSGIEEASGLAWHLLGNLDEPGRLRVWEAALPGLEQEELGRVLLEIVRRAPGDLRAILWQGNSEVSRLAGQAWAENEPRAALTLFQEMLANGPPERRRQAIELIGFLPREATALALPELLIHEHEPDMRVAILGSMAGAGILTASTLLTIIADPGESDAVRTFAAQQLNTSDLNELQNDVIVREILRISHMPLPESTRRCLAELMEKLRKVRPAGLTAGTVERWERMINPYRPGRPLTEPALFFGRETLMHQLRVAVENGNHTLLLGERQAGKTTILRLLQWKMTEEAAQGVPVRCAYLNLAGLEPHEFFETLLRATIEQLHDPRLAAETQIPRPYTDAHFERDLGELLGYLAASLGPGVRLALLLDDADIILGYPQSTHIGLKRILSSPASAGLALILAGRDLLHSWSQTEPPFYSAFPTYPVSPLANDAAQRLVTQPVEGVFQYEPDALELILQTTQGRPAKIQTICQQLINDLLASGDQLVTADLVRAALGQTGLARAELLSQAGQLLEELLDWVEDHPGAPHPDLQAQIKRTWEALGRALVQGVRSIQR